MYIFLWMKCIRRNLVRKIFTWNVNVFTFLYKSIYTIWEQLLESGQFTHVFKQWMTSAKWKGWNVYNNVYICTLTSPDQKRKECHTIYNQQHEGTLAAWQTKPLNGGPLMARFDLLLHSSEAYKRRPVQYGAPPVKSQPGGPVKLPFHWDTFLSQSNL